MHHFMIPKCIWPNIWHLSNVSHRPEEGLPPGKRKETELHRGHVLNHLRDGNSDWKGANQLVVDTLLSHEDVVPSVEGRQPRQEHNQQTMIANGKKRELCDIVGSVEINQNVICLFHKDLQRWNQGARREGREGVPRLLYLCGW